MTLTIRATQLILLLPLSAAITHAQSSNPSKEYIRLGGQIIAIENGQPPTAPIATLNPQALTFPSQTLNTTSPAKSTTLTNSGNAPLIISTVTLTGADPGDFASTNTCAGVTLAPNATCSISVTFTPTTSGTRQAAVSIADNAADSPQNVSLTGTGAQPAPVPILSVSTLPFNTINLGTTAPSQSATLTNTGNAPLIISTVSLGGINPADFSISNNCAGVTLAPNANCSISATFTPTATGTRQATVFIADNAANSPQSIALNGTGANAPIANLSPNPLPSFGNQNVNITSASQSITLSNIGTAALSITSIAITGANAVDFAETNNCGTSLAVNANCTITVTFTPSTVGNRSGSVAVTDNAGNSPQSVALTGSGVAPGAVLSPATLPFGSLNTGTTSAPPHSNLDHQRNCVAQHYLYRNYWHKLWRFRHLQQRLRRIPSRWR